MGLNKSIASHAESVEEKYQEMTSAPIGHTLAVLSAPAWADLAPGSCRLDSYVVPRG